MNAALLLAAALLTTGEGWWQRQPVRLFQTNLREIDAAADGKGIVEATHAFGANTLLFGMGGLAAFYPTDHPYHRRSPHLPKGRDLFGEVLRAAHERKIRVIGRFDFSKLDQQFWKQHPDWFLRAADGRSVSMGDVYVTCMNGPYWRQHALTMVEEALERYPVDGVFLNMGNGNPKRDFQNKEIGPCHCDHCRRLYPQKTGEPLPPKRTPRYDQFVRDESRALAERFAEVIRRKRPQAMFLSYVHDMGDAVATESSSAVDRPTPHWPYSASENVNRARHLHPHKPSVNLCMNALDHSYRFSSIHPEQIRVRLHQNIAHGAAPAFAVVGVFDQPDRTGLEAARPVFAWHERHETTLHGQVSLAEVQLLTSRDRHFDVASAERGLVRLLSELHIPFALSDDLSWVDKDPKRYALVVSAGGATPELLRYVRAGGRALLVGTTAPPESLAKVVRRWPDTRGAYLRVEDRATFPSLVNLDRVFVAGEYLELATDARPLLSFIPPDRSKLPEKVSHGPRTEIPGAARLRHGDGQVVLLPWDVSGLYDRLGAPAHRALVGDLVDGLLPAGRQLRTNAHPAVETTLMRQPRANETLVHLVNLSGAAGHTFHEPLPMANIDLRVRGSFKSARTLVGDRKLPVTKEGNHTRVRLPSLGAYEAVVLR